MCVEKSYWDFQLLDSILFLIFLDVSFVMFAIIWYVFAACHSIIPVNLL